MKILLHICCAPCALYAVEALKKQGHCIEGLFYNPNIHPYSEYSNRLGSVKKMTDGSDIKVDYQEYDLDRFFRNTSSNMRSPHRCFTCWQMRLQRTAKVAGEKGFDGFTTTLLISPYQDHEALKSIGESIEKESKVKFHYVDLRKGFKLSHQQSRQKGFYMQKYCGCIFSEVEKCTKR